MNDQHPEALEVCLSAMKTGVDLEQCLKMFPDLSEELRGPLVSALFARALVDQSIPNAAFQRSRARLLGKAEQLRQKPEKGKSLLAWLGRAPRLAFAAFALALVLFLGWQGLQVASAKALPGDPLYPVKRVAENFNLQLLPENETRRVIEARYEQRRIEEVQLLLQMGRTVDVRFTGLVNDQSQERWMIDGIPVNLPSPNESAGQIDPGMVVVVEGQTQPGGWVEAFSIRLHSYQIVGLVESISSRAWKVSGLELQISRSSQIDPAVRIGDRVIVLVQVSEDGLLQARAILRFLQPALISEGPSGEGGSRSPTQAAPAIGEKDEGEIEDQSGPGDGSEDENRGPEEEAVSPDQEKSDGSNGDLDQEDPEEKHDEEELKEDGEGGDDPVDDVEVEDHNEDCVDETCGDSGEGSEGDGGDHLEEGCEDESCVNSNEGSESEDGDQHGDDGEHDERDSPED